MELKVTEETTIIDEDTGVEYILEEGDIIKVEERFNIRLTNLIFNKVANEIIDHLDLRNEGDNYHTFLKELKGFFYDLYIEAENRPVEEILKLVKNIK